MGSTLCDWVFAHAERTPDAPAVDSPEHRLTYRALADRAIAAARALRRAGVQRGDRVLIVASNVPATVVVQIAIQQLGAVEVSVSHEWSAEQLAFAFEQSDARCAVFAGRDARRIVPLVSQAGIEAAILLHSGPVPPGLESALDGLAWTRMSESGECVSQGAEKHEPSVPRNRSPDELVSILYTSGSTGRPRAVMQTIGNIEANTSAIAAYLELDARDRAMLILPLSYCYGRSVLLTHLFVGGSVFLDSRFMYPRVVLDAVGAEGCTGFAGVPLTFELLRRHTEPDMRKMPALRYLTQAGGAMSLETADWVRSRFHPAALFIMYGQTEATARLSYLPPSRAAEKRGSAGIALSNVELRIVDREGNELPRRERGHVVARGPSITPGYWRSPEETGTILRDGWLWTGDLGYLDEEGFLFLLGRANELMKLGGHRVSPGEIEAALAQHSAVSEVAVVPLSDELMGQVPAALVVPRKAAGVTERELRKHCADRLPPFMVPRLVRFTRELPRNASGKIARERVAEALRPGAQGEIDNRQER